MQIAITGIGVISALGNGVEANRELLLKGQSALRKPKLLSTDHQEWPVGEVRFSNDELSEHLALANAVLSRNVLLGMMALQETIADAHLDADILAKTPLINGTTVGGMDLTEQYYADWKRGDFSHISLIEQHEADKTSHLLCNHFGLANYTTISTACSSALNAIIHGAGLLRTGETKQVIVGGTEAMTKFHLNGFASLGILSTSVCRPFQDDRDGINLGEGAAYLVLEDAAQAQKRGATIYGYLAGYGNSCDAYHQTASSPDGDGAFEAMQKALSMGHIQPCDISYINAHGTATVNNDASELCAIKRLFGDKLPKIESTKSLTGHTTSASGSIEAIFTLIKMRKHNFSFAISNAFGFGGNDSSIVLSQLPVNIDDADISQPIHQTSLLLGSADIDYKDIIPAIQARRMTPLIRQLLVIAKQALKEASLEKVDGIVVGTRWGGMIPTIQLLNQLTTEGEQNLSPAQFMNSTHNSAAGILARFLQCHGYNTTIVAEQDVFAKALKDAQLQLKTRANKSILVCSIDEVNDSWKELGQQSGIEITNKVQAQVIWQD